MSDSHICPHCGDGVFSDEEFDTHLNTPWLHGPDNWSERTDLHQDSHEVTVPTHDMPNDVPLLTDPPYDRGLSSDAPGGASGLKLSAWEGIPPALNYVPSKDRSFMPDRIPWIYNSHDHTLHYSDPGSWHAPIFDHLDTGHEHAYDLEEDRDNFPHLAAGFHNLSSGVTRAWQGSHHVGGDHAPLIAEHLPREPWGAIEQLDSNSGETQNPSLVQGDGDYGMTNAIG